MDDSPGLLSEVKDFLSSLKRELPAVFAPPPAGLSPGRRLPFRGGELLYSVARDPSCLRATLREAPQGLEIILPPDDPARPSELLALWCRRKAREVFAQRAAHWSAAMGVAYKRLRVKDQRSLWGSCSRDGGLNFNWRVVMAPPEILDYLVIHELAHLLEMNHSQRFWRHVARWSPDYKAHRRWLREHGGGLKRRLPGRRRRDLRRYGIIGRPADLKPCQSPPT
jgi:predicted metal-dependent hydrolase